MRVYLPATAADLATAAPHLGIAISGERTGFTLTFPQATPLSEAETEELEWEAFLTAAASSARLLAADPNSSPMRVVLSLDVPPAAITATSPLANRQLSGVVIPDLRDAKIAAIHVDEPATAPLIARLRAEPESTSALAAVLDADLLWYDPTELADIPIP